MTRRSASDKPIPSGVAYPSEWTLGSFFRFIKKRKMHLALIKFSCSLCSRYGVLVSKNVCFIGMRCGVVRRQGVRGVFFV